MMQYWWVNQNKTYKTEVPGGFMWSPKRKANGDRSQFYENMVRVLPGDVIFSFCDTRIKAVGIATGKAQSSPKPEFGAAGSNWAQEGWLVPVEYVELSHQIRPKDNIDKLRQHLPEKYSPLQQDGNGLQSVYLAEVPAALASALIDLIGKEFQTVSTALTQDTETDQEDAESVEESIYGRTDIGPTTKEQLVKSRRGQGIFKANVRLNETYCRVTRISDLKHLRASHIKPWKDSSDEEKLNGCNGLLLAPHIDHLFDKGFISFSDSGAMLISPQLDESVLIKWGVQKDLNVGAFKKAQMDFLEFHRTSVFKAYKSKN